MPIKDLEVEIRSRTDQIWTDEPPDIRRLRLGVSDSGAGTYGQMLGTFLYVQSEIRGLAVNACVALLECAQNELFTIVHLRASARAHLAGRAGLLNYSGLHECGELFLKFVNALDEIETKEDFVRVLRALKTYGVRMHMWTLYLFPWHLGLGLSQRTPAAVEELRKEVDKGAWATEAYDAY